MDTIEMPRRRKEEITMRCHLKYWEAPPISNGVVEAQSPECFEDTRFNSAYERCYFRSPFRTKSTHERNKLSATYAVAAYEHTELVATWREIPYHTYVGFGLLCQHEDAQWPSIEEIMVFPDARHGKHGRRIVLTLLQVAQNIGKKCVTLTCDPNKKLGDKDSIFLSAFYEQCGFQKYE